MSDRPTESPGGGGVGHRRALVVGGAAAAGVALVGLVALVVSDALRLGGADPAIAERSEPAPTTTIADAGPDTGDCRAPLTRDDPLRLWIGGDSLAGSLGPALGEQTAATGVVEPVVDTRVGSGLSSPEQFSWPRRAAADMARVDPEVVVFIIGANDWTAPSADPGWQLEYGQHVEEMIDLLDGDGRIVYWVGSPTMRERRKDVGVRQVNDVARNVVQLHRDARYVDAYSLFADEQGAFTATLPRRNGRSVRVRASDGIHFTPEGGEVLARKVFEPLDARCGLTYQAVRT